MTAAWRLTIDTTGTRILAGPTLNVWVVEGDGPRPILEDLAPPPPEPPPAPVGDPYAPQLGEDTSTFHFPPDGPRYQARDFDRNYALAMESLGADYHAAEPDAGNPSIYSHANAGIIAQNGRTAYGRAVGGLRLWVRVVAGEGMRGEVMPVAPPHLIRRALKQGHL